VSKGPKTQLEREGQKKRVSSAWRRENEFEGHKEKKKYVFLHFCCD